MNRRPRHAVLMTLLLVSPLLGGCFGDRDVNLADATSPPDQAAGMLRFGEPTFVGEAGSSLGEASIDVGPDGSMLVCAVSTNKVWASEDGGETWRPVLPFGDTRNGDCDVAISPAGDWYAVFARWTPAGERDLSVSVSRDRGGTWEEHAITPPVPLHRHCPVPPFGGCFAHRPWLQAVDESLYLTYFNIVPATLFFQRSDDGGKTWNDPTMVNLDARFGISGDMAIGDDGRTIHVPLVRGVPAGSDGERVGVEDELRPWVAWYTVATSRDGGDSWALHEVAGPVEVRIGFPSVAWGASGDLYYAMTLANESKADLSISVSRDGGEGWSSPSLVASGAEPRPGLAYLALDPSPDGGVLALWNTWAERDGSTGWVVKVAKLQAQAPDIVQWTVDATDPTGQPGTIEFFEARHGPQGRLHIAYPVPQASCQGGTNRDCIYHLVSETS